MPTKHKKVPPQNRGTGSAARGGQKAVTGSGRSPGVADEAAESRRQEVDEADGAEEATEDESQREVS